MHRLLTAGLTVLASAVPVQAATGSTGPATAAGPASADLVLVGGNFITMAAEPARAEAVAIADGMIVAVGDGADVEAFIGPSTQTSDLGGAPVIPGLVDAHSHFFEDGLRQGIGAHIQDVEILPNGITTTAEMHTGSDLVDTMRGYDAAGELRVRTSLYLTYTDACGALQGDWWKAYPPTRRPGEMLRIGGVKVFSDGGACNAPAVSYLYPDGGNGDLYFDVDQLEAIVREIDGAGHQAVVHALGDRAVETVLAALGRVIGDSGNPRRHRIDHNAIVRPDMYGRHQEAGAVAVLFGAFPTCALSSPVDGPRFRTPAELQSWEWPWRALLDTNPATTFAWQVDYPARPASLGANLAGLVTRVEGDCPPTPAQAAGTVTVDEALAMMTLGSAYALGRETEVGSLEVGKYADLVVLNQDPTDVDPAALGATEALMTMVGGRVEYCRAGHAELCPTPPAPVCPTGAPNLALGAAVSASSAQPERPAPYAVDGDETTGWGSGANPEQWIELDLGASWPVRCIRLLVDQYPAGSTVHRVTGGVDPAPVAVLGAFDGPTEAGQWLVLTGEWDVRHLRVTTAASPSWVAWYEIEVF